jgi:hypothetical protein
MAVGPVFLWTTIAGNSDQFHFATIEVRGGINTCGQWQDEEQDCRECSGYGRVHSLRLKDEFVTLYHKTTRIGICAKKTNDTVYGVNI